jgi:hypothetical protein
LVCHLVFQYPEVNSRGIKGLSQSIGILTQHSCVRPRYAIQRTGNTVINSFDLRALTGNKYGILAKYIVGAAPVCVNAIGIVSVRSPCQPKLWFAAIYIGRFNAAEILALLWVNRAREGEG